VPIAAIRSVDRAEGTDLIDIEGRRYIDGVSSLWCNVHGHGHPRIDAAVRAQLARVSHSTMLGLSQRPGIELAQRLVEIAPPGLTRVFYSDSGSTATEIQRGQPKRTNFVALRMGLPRRHSRLGVGRRDRPLPLDLPPAAVRHAEGRAG
jgi:adenosylmethionine-8-amino-7-oxononanoate aminotransferase